MTVIKGKHPFREAASYWVFSGAKGGPRIPLVWRSSFLIYRSGAQCYRHTWTMTKWYFLISLHLPSKQRAHRRHWLELGAFLNKSPVLPTSSFLHLVLLPVQKDHCPPSTCPDLDPNYTNKRGSNPLTPCSLSDMNISELLAGMKKISI